MWRGGRWLVWCYFAVGCGASQPASGSIDWGPRPPPKPGNSIGGSRMCECQVCQPRACCQGADESQADCDLDQTVSTSGDTLDFGAGEGCGIEVQSCTARCSIEVWRVGAKEACDTRRPEACCMTPSEAG